MAESFGRLLQRYRLQAGLSQEQLAERAGVSTNAISSLERRLRLAPHSATLELLIAALKLDGGARAEIEEAARVARARRAQAQRYKHDDLSEESFRDNLPPELTSFVDREKERAEIKELIQSHRLVTIVGAGGAGKTRCAMKVGRDLCDQFIDGTWLVDLATTSDPALVSSAVARALRVQEPQSRPVLDALLAYLKRKHLILILDNCEHVIDEARRMVTAILRDCSNLRILATSRESLSIAGERAYRMPSLPVPSTSESLSEGDMSRYGAVQLFRDRAASADNGFTLTAESAPHIVEICRRLDGIPLAIELAAARGVMRTPKPLAQRLDERFRVLTGGDRSALPRHRTMRALIDWSYDLLSGDERRFFRSLSIFAGGFTLEAATAVCGNAESDDIEIIDALSSLVDKSLVQALMVHGDTRYRLLESTRQYAREKLRESGEEEMVAHSHARFFFELAQHLYDTWGGTPDRVWYAQAEPELENVRSALSWAFGPSGDVLVGQRLAGALRQVWYTFGPAEGRRWIEIAQRRATAQTPAAVLAALDLAESAFASWLSQYKVSLALAERALIRYREVADPRGIAAAESQIGRAQLFLGRTSEAEEIFERTLEEARVTGARTSELATLEVLALAHQFAGDLSGARQRFREALAVAQAMGSERRPTFIAMNLAELEFRDGDVAEALSLANEALEALHRFGDVRSVARAWFNMAAYLIALRRFDEARAAARNGLAAASDAQFSVGLVWTVQHLGAIAALRPVGDAPVVEVRRHAARLIGYVEARLAELEASRQYTEQQEHDAMMTALHDALGADELARFMAQGASWTEDRAIAEAMRV